MAYSLSDIARLYEIDQTAYRDLEQEIFALYNGRIDERVRDNIRDQFTNLRLAIFTNNGVEDTKIALQETWMKALENQKIYADADTVRRITQQFAQLTNPPLHLDRKIDQLIQALDPSSQTQTTVLLALGLLAGVSMIALPFLLPAVIPGLVVSKAVLYSCAAEGVALIATSGIAYGFFHHKHKNHAPAPEHRPSMEV